MADQETATRRPRDRWHTEQAAALPYRRSEAGVEVLLVTSRTTRRWVLPKGSISNGLSPQETAVVEAYEEAGVHGYIGRTCIGVYGYTKKNEKKRKRCVVRVYPLRVTSVRPNWPEKSERRRQWVLVPVARARVHERALRRILFAFERQHGLRPLSVVPGRALYALASVGNR